MGIFTTRNLTDKRNLGIVASVRMRKTGVPEGHTLGELIRANPELFASRFIFTTRGTYDDAIGKERFAVTGKWHAKWEGWDGFVLRPGKLGGVMEMASLLEGGTDRRDRVEALIFLTGPDVLEEGYPEDRALLRSAIRNNVVLLPTFHTALLWSACEADRRYCPPGYIKPFEKGDTLALIAHDKRKIELCCWAVRHRERLRNFDRIITTGTTGTLVGNFLEAVGVDRSRIDARYSGPEGGDVQIAVEVLYGRCRHVVFFVDPMTSHPHEADIQSLMRICTMPDVGVNLRLTEAAASSWITSIPGVE